MRKAKIVGEGTGVALSYARPCAPLGERQSGLPPPRLNWNSAVEAAPHAGSGRLFFAEAFQAMRLSSANWSGVMKLAVSALPGRLSAAEGRANVLDPISSSGPSHDQSPWQSVMALTMNALTSANWDTESPA